MSWLAAVIGAFLGAFASTVGVPVWLLVLVLFALIVVRWRKA